MKKQLFSLLCGAAAFCLAAQNIEMDIIQKAVVSDHLVDGRSPINPAGIARTADGELLVMVSDSTDMIPPSRNYILRSRDNGKTWVRDEQPLFTNPDPVTAVSAQMFQLPDGNLLFAVGVMTHSRAPQGNNDLMRNIHIRLYCHTELYTSSDNGKTVTKLQNLTEPEAYRTSATNGSLLQLANGDLLLPGYLENLPNRPGQGSGFWRSTDGGKTWGAFEKAFTNLPGKRFNEATYVQKDDGTIVGFARWDKNWHPDRDNGDNQLSEEMHKITSTDNGKTWSSPVPTNMLTIYPVSTRLDNGVFVLFGGKRDDGTRDRTCHIWASLDGENYTDLGQVYYFKPEHRNGLMDSSWGTTGGCSAIYPLPGGKLLAAFNGGSPFALDPYHTYIDSNIINISPAKETEQIQSANILLNAGNYRVTGGKAETILLDGEEVLKVTGPAVLESKTAIAVDPDTEKLKLQLQFRSGSGENGINYFGARCFKDAQNVINPVFWTVEQSKTELAESCRAEDCFIKVKDASKWWRSNYFRLKIGSYITGRDLGIVRKKNGYYLVQLQQPCGTSAPAGTPVYLQCNGTADVFFGGTMRGLNNWRSIDALSNTKNHAFSPRHLRPGTKFARLLMRLNQEGNSKSIVYIKGIKLEKIR